MKHLRRLALAGVAVLVLAGCGDSFMPEAVTEQGETTANLWRIFLWVAAGVGLLVYVLIAIVVIRYRRRRHDDDSAPSQQQSQHALEVLWTAVPLVIVAILFGISLPAEDDITSVSPDPDLVVEVRGFQWQWQFRYPESGIEITGVPGRPPTLVLPVDRTVRLKLDRRRRDPLLLGAELPREARPDPGRRERDRRQRHRAGRVVGRLLGVLRSRPLEDELLAARRRRRGVRRVGPCRRGG